MLHIVPSLPLKLLYLRWYSLVPTGRTYVRWRPFPKALVGNRPPAQARVWHHRCPAELGCRPRHGILDNGFEFPTSGSRRVRGAPLTRLRAAHSAERLRRPPAHGLSSTRSPRTGGGLAGGVVRRPSRRCRRGDSAHASIAVAAGLRILACLSAGWHLPPACRMRARCATRRGRGLFHDMLALV